MWIVGLVLSGQKTLQSLSCICIFLSRIFAGFHLMLEWFCGICEFYSVWFQLVRFHITLASHWEQFTENWSQWEAKNQPRFKLDRLTGAPRIKNKAQFQIIWQQDMFVIQWHEMNELTTCRYYVKSFHLKPWNYTRSLLFHLGRKSLWYERFLWRCA